MSSNSIGSSSILPASILLRSSTSLRIASRASPDWRTTFRRSRWVSANSPMAMIWAIASTPLSGVRISWLMLARNCDFSTLAASAASRASVSSPMVARRAWSLTCSLASRPLKVSVSRPSSSSAIGTTVWAKSPLSATWSMASDRRRTGSVTRPASHLATNRARPVAAKNRAAAAEK